ncbi:UPF0092 membrane protein YajC [Candidatus Westeberhardia cardiocondylae]|uniref:Sec translocon accessory complex subunit YajC n=1 Tax=Candidatus Westeberhardia cardiocondylae TaxID=1594731 RepID=A0A0H5BWN4_9ENTR|nr:preprotein translocase subunit YajC [Candidatus Westeberhardia cardiocondylae]MCR3756426.1 Sec translocon accessory complex subunit YajC [Candidatus Westeberhardia cardiocondylae]CEN32122.1 UPF0092 membrane protein YajC [Candidatus Westeberhardia cardiocondylae]
MISIIYDVFANNENLQYQENPFSFIIILLLFSLIFYFTIFRPQQKRAKAHKKLINNIRKEDEILTTGGLIGRVTKTTKNDYILISLNSSNEVIIKKDSISAILPKGTIKTLL